MSSPPSAVRSTARRWSSAALVGRLQTITSPVSFSYQRNAGTSKLEPCRMPSWLAPVWLDQSVRQDTMRWLPSSQSETVGIRPLPAARRSTSYPTPSSWRKTSPGADPKAPGAPVPLPLRRRRSARR